MATADVGGANLAYEVHGESGDPLVLVHDAWMDSSTFAGVLPLLDRAFRVLVFDRRGYGRNRSVAQGGPLVQVADLVALIDAAGFNPTHVAGVGVGASIALSAAVLRPDIVRSVIGHEPPLFHFLPGDEPATVSHRPHSLPQPATGVASRGGTAREYVDDVAFGPGTWERLSPHWREIIQANAGAGGEEAASPPGSDLTLEDLRGFDPPALLTHGDSSPVRYQQVADRICEAMPNATHRVYLGVGHSPPISDATLYAGSLIAFCLERSVPVS